MASGIPLPISQLPALTSALSNTIMPVTQNGKTGSITLAILLGGPYASSTSIVGTETVLNNNAGTLQSTTVAQFINQCTAAASLTGAENIQLSPGTGSVKKATLAQLITLASTASNPSATDVIPVVQGTNYRQDALSQIADFKNVYTDTGTANAYVITPSPAYTAYFPGMEVLIKIANTNGIGTSNVNVSALGNKAIQLLGSVTPSPGQLPAGHVAHLVYNGSTFTLLNPARAFQGIYAALNANQSISSSTLTAATWKTAIYDTMGFSTGSTYSIVTIPSGYGISYIRVSGVLNWNNASSVLSAYATLFKNGSTFNLQAGAAQAASSGNTFVNYVFPILSTTAGDTWGIQVFQNSGGALNLLAAGSWFQLEVVQ